MDLKRDKLHSDVSLTMDDVIEKSKKHKANMSLRDKVRDMSSAVAPGYPEVPESIIKRAYFQGIKLAEDMAAANDDFEHDKKDSKVDRVMNKLRIGWIDPKLTSKKILPVVEQENYTHGDFLDDRQNHINSSRGENNMGMTQINQESPELQG